MYSCNFYHSKFSWNYFRDKLKNLWVNLYPVSKCLFSDDQVSLECIHVLVCPIHTQKCLEAKWFCSVHICNLHIKCHCLLHVVYFMSWFVLPNAQEKSAHSTARSDVTAAFVRAENARVETFQLHWPQPPFHIKPFHIWKQRRIWICWHRLHECQIWHFLPLSWGRRSAAWSCNARRATPSQTLPLNVGFVTLTFVFGQWWFKRHCWSFSIICFPCKDAFGNIPSVPWECSTMTSALQSVPQTKWKGWHN